MHPSTQPIDTYGLSHLALEVADPEVSLAFYRRLFGVREYFRDENSIQVLGPGKHDVIAFVRSERAGVTGGIKHFGFRLKDPHDMPQAIAAAEAAGATIRSHGEFAPGFPYVFIADPDGYEIEVWFE